MPTILAWLESVPESALAHLEVFGVGDRGEFIAEFRKRPNRGGPPRKVTHTFDHNLHAVWNDIGIWKAPKPIPFHDDHLNVVVNAF